MRLFEMYVVSEKFNEWTNLEMFVQDLKKTFKKLPRDGIRDGCQ